jgi:hypothetical protein
MAVADHGLLHLQGSVLRHRQVVQHGGANCSAARLSKQQR